MPVRGKRKIDPLPEEFPSLAAAGEFWDTHDLTDYLEQIRPVKDYQCRIEKEYYLVPLEPSVAHELRKAAKRRGMTSTELARRWIGEKLKLIRKK